MDEETKREAALPNDQPVSLQRIFLGGIPAAVEQTSNRANVPFQGCIWNLMVNAVYVTSHLYTHPHVLNLGALAFVYLEEPEMEPIREVKVLFLSYLQQRH